MGVTTNWPSSSNASATDWRPAPALTGKSAFRQPIRRAGKPYSSATTSTSPADLPTIQADGANYHLTYTTRDRDRLRQQVLESKGWRFHRIWSAAWFRHHEAELDEAEETWKRAVKASDRDESYPLLVPPSIVRQGTPHHISPYLTDAGRVLRFRRRERLTRTSPTTHTQLVMLARCIKSNTLLGTDDNLILRDDALAWIQAFG